MSVRAGFFTHDDNRAIGVRRWMIDVTRDDDGDANPAVAMVLAQIIWWCSQDSKTGKPRHEHDHGNNNWFVRDDSSKKWQEELGLSPRAIRRARLRLVRLGLVEVKTLVDGGVRCTHIRRLPIEDHAELEGSDQPSTMWPEVPPDPMSIDGSGHMRDPVLAESHACASPSLSLGDEIQESREASDKPKPIRSISFPHGWEPNEAHAGLARSLGVTLTDEAEQFADFHQAKGSTFKDWDAAFRTWLRNATKFRRATGSGPRPPRDPNIDDWWNN